MARYYHWGPEPKYWGLPRTIIRNHKRYYYFGLYNSKEMTGYWQRALAKGGVKTVIHKKAIYTNTALEM